MSDRSTGWPLWRREGRQRFGGVRTIDVVTWSRVAGPVSLSRLLDAVMAIGSELDLAVTLKRIAEAARSLVDRILGLLIADPRPIRVPDLPERPRASVSLLTTLGCAHSWGCRSSSAEVVFGDRYLTDKQSFDAFTDIDEELTVALAAAAGAAIENARLYPSCAT